MSLEFRGLGVGAIERYHWPSKHFLLNSSNAKVLFSNAHSYTFSRANVFEGKLSVQKIVQDSAMLTVSVKMRFEFTYPKHEVSLTYSVLSEKDNSALMKNTETFYIEKGLRVKTLESKDFDLCVDPSVDYCLLLEVEMTRVDDSIACLPSADQLALMESIGEFLVNQKLCDVKLVTRDGEELLAHKLVLAACSSVFSSMFEHDMRERKENVVEIDDTDHEVLRAVLDFVYRGGTERVEERVCEVLHAADKYQIASLKKFCERVIARNLSAAEAVKTLILADRYHCEELKVITAEFIAANGSDVVETDEFEDLKSENSELLEFIFRKMFRKT